MNTLHEDLERDLQQLIPDWPHRAIVIRVICGLLIIIAILFLIFPVVAQEAEIFVCTVTEPDKAVECPNGGNPARPIIWRIENWHPDLVDEWRLNVEYINQPGGGRDISYNAPLKKEPLTAGQRVNAMLGEDGKLIPVARCNVRTYRQVEEFTKQGQQAPLSAKRPPDDCVDRRRY